MKEVDEFQYFGQVLCKYGIMESKTKERVASRRKVVGYFQRKDSKHEHLKITVRWNNNNNNNNTDNNLRKQNLGVKQNS